MTFINILNLINQILKYIPHFLRNKIEHRPGLVKILDNIGWLFFDKVLRMGVGLLVGVWVARYLGPENFGLMNYAMAFTGLFGAIASLGLQGIVIRDIVNSPKDSNVFLGTAFILRFLGGLISFLAIIITISLLRPDEALTKTIVAIFGFSLVIQTGEVIKWWFESQVQSKFVVWIENGVFLFIAAVKVGMILSHASLLAFVIAAFFEALLGTIFLLLFYWKRTGSLTSWKPELTIAKRLLRDSWPLILSGLAVAIYMKIDQIMLGQMLGDQAVGIYSAAVRISEVWYFIPGVIVASVFPSIVEARKTDKNLYYERLQKLYDLIVWIAFAVAIPMTFLSSWLVTVLFGNDYNEAGPILSIHIWSALFVFLGVASSNWFLVENRQILSFQRTALGALANFILNLFLIPKYGVIGAAYATVISYSVVALFYDLLQKETRRMFRMKIKSFNIFRMTLLIWRIKK